MEYLGTCLKTCVTYISWSITIATCLRKHLDYSYETYIPFLLALQYCARGARQLTTDERRTTKDTPGTANPISN
jgi:hypothetical protein